MRIEQNTKNAVKIIFGIGVVIITASLLTGCGTDSVQGLQGNPGQAGAQGPTGATGAPGASPSSTPMPCPSASPNPVSAVINNYNEYLVSQGNDPLTPGLRCTLYTVPNMPSNPCLLAADIAGCNQVSASAGYAAVGSFTYTGAVDQADELGSQGFNMLPINLQSLYPDNFAVTCTGYFVNPDYNYHEFDVQSDDGSLLYINGSLVVQNDGEHSSADVMAERYLQAAVYTFNLQYFQGPGYVNLVVNEDGNLLPATQLWH